MEKLTIAVSGDEGSFSEEAAFIYAQRNNIEPKIFYGIDFEGVFNALEKKEASLGIFPVVNSRGVLVKSAFQAMGKHKFEFIEQYVMEMKQCLMVKKDKSRKDIRKIASHPQAIAQCEQYLHREFPDIRLIYWDDTAKAARDLAQGVIPDDTAVIAPARCAEQYDLKLIDKGIQDTNPNFMTFIVVKK